MDPSSSHRRICWWNRPERAPDNPARFPATDKSWQGLPPVSISGTSARPGAVFAGSAAALVLASLVGAAAGGSLSSVIPTDALQLAASVGFLIIGTRLILRSREEAAPAEATVDGALTGGEQKEDPTAP